MAEVTREYLKEQADRARASVKRIVEEQKDAIDQVFEILEVGGGAFAAGFLHGRNGAMPTYWGVPADAGIGVIGVGIGMMKFTGARHVFRIGLGVFSYWTGNLGAQVGQKLRKSSPDWKGTPMQTDANGQAIGADGKPIPYQVRNILAGGMPRGNNANHGFAPAYQAGANMGWQQRNY